MHAYVYFLRKMQQDAIQAVEQVKTRHYPVSKIGWREQERGRGI